MVEQLNNDDRVETKPNALIAGRLLAIALATAVIARGLIALALYILPQLIPIRVWDDALMWQRYAANLATGSGISWNPGGPPTYGLTSPLFLVIVVPVHALFGAHLNAAQLAAICSGVAGAIWVALTFWMVDEVLRGRAWWARWLAALLALWVMTYTQAHYLALATTGMDTLFVAAYLTLFLGLLARYLRLPTRKLLIVLAVVAPLAYLARPDLLLFTMPIMLMLRSDRYTGAVVSRDRSNAFYGSIALVALILLACNFYFGTPVPLSFYAKSTHMYGSSIFYKYALVPQGQLLLYLWMHRWLIAVLAIGLIARLIKKPDYSAYLDLALLIAASLYMLYYRFEVLQIMYGLQRFYAPTLPVLLYLGARALALIVPAAAESERSRREWMAAGGVTVCAVLIVVMASWQSFARSLPAQDQWNMTLAQLYQDRWSNYMACLDQVSALPKDAGFATTEVGLTGVMNPNKQIVDLAGLNDTDIGLNGLDPNKFFAAHEPDLIYLPHPDYVDMLNAMLASGAFQRDYVLFPRNALHAEIDVAVKRNSPYFSQLDSIFRAREGSKSF